MSEISSSSSSGSIEYSYPLSPLQEGMLFHTLYAPHSGVYVQQLVGVLHEELDCTAFREAWRWVVDRHPVLRTSAGFAENSSGELLQRVHTSSAASSLAFEEHDLGGIDASEREERVRLYIEADRRRGFDVGDQTPLIRLAVFRMDEADYRLVWTSHYALLDGRSRLRVLKELFSAYEALCRGEIPRCEPPARPYRDYIEWLGTHDDIAEAERFWGEALRGFSAPTPLGGGAAASRSASSPDAEGGGGITRRSVRLSEASTGALKRLAGQNGLTLNTLVQGAWALLLSRYSGEEDVVFGATRACRKPPDGPPNEVWVGLFINTLPVRVRVRPEELLIPWLQKLRAQWRAAREYEHTPLVGVQAWSELPGGSPLFESVVVYEHQSLQAALRVQEEEGEEGGRWAGREFRLDQATNYPLTVSAWGEPELLLEISFDGGRFEGATIERMVGHLRTLLEGMGTHPESRLCELELLTEAERHQLLFEYNDTATEYPDACVHTLFEEQAERSPEAVAVVFEDEHITYRQLNENSNRLASVLRERGIGKGSYVPVLMDRSIELVVSLLCVMKSGAAFVPLDPRWPTERIRWILDDLGSEVVLLNKETLAQEEALGRPSLVVDIQTTETSIPNPDIELDPSEPIYVIYTSGSTGRPKGAINAHRGIANRLLWMNEFFGRESAAVVLHTTHHVFDSAVCQLLWPLINGGKTVVPSPMMEMSADYPTTLIEKHGVTNTDFVPSLFNVLVPRLVTGSEMQHKLRSLRSLIVGGEEITPSTTYAFLEHFPSVRVTNLYGPTEASIGCICHEVRGNENDKIPIGKPIANAQALILDREMNLVPIGVVGELYITGTCLGLGYLNNEEKTRAAFVENPFGEIDHDKLYKTGDLARYLPDGEIEFLGRIDHQVKIRGFRVELGEIEATLRRHPALHQGVVIAREDLPGEDKRLVAYVVLNQHAATPSVSDLRSFVREKLPEYMVPSAYVVLGTLPLTPNGKIDRRALPAPDPSGFRAQSTYAAPRTPLEERLVEIWAEVLGLGRVGVQDNFFELGGHSLLATRVVSRVRAVLGVELPLLSLFEAPTIAGLAERIGIARQGAQSLPAPPLVPLSRDRHVLPSFAQQRLWFLDQLEPDTPTYNISNAVRLEGTLDAEALKSSLKEIVRRHEALRTTFTALDGEPVQLIAATMDMKLPIEDLTTLPEAQREDETKRLALEEKRRPFELERGPLFRARLLRLGQEQHLLLLTMHHIVSDGWSMGVFWREFGALYEAFSEGKPTPLEELPVQYADYALWQRGWLQGEVLDRQLTYWRQQLDDVPTLDFPTDRPRPPIQTHHGARQSLMLPPSLSEGLRESARKEGATLFMVLLAAFQVLLSRYAGQQDVAVGSPIAGRNRSETEGLIGCFVNTLVMRTDLSGDPTFRELLSRVREVALGAYDHQDLPFEKLVEELRPERDPSRTPLFQVLFALQNTPRTTLKLPKLTLERLNVESETAKTDLSLFMFEEAQGLKGGLEYNADLFDEATIERMLDHFRTLLEGIVEDPERRLSELPLLTEGERHRLLFEWNDTRREYPDVCIHELFEEQAERTPDAVAVVLGDEQLTYRELNGRANQLARHLRALGVRPEVLVGICVERSLEMMVGLLGVLKAGGAYVPLDPAYPKQRLAFMLEDTQAPVLLTQERLVEGLPEHEAEIVCLDAHWPLIARKAEDSPAGAATADNLAYVIYTSGSTGQPKGVMVEHRALCGFMVAATTSREITASDRVLQFCALSFDNSIVEIFPPLIRGGTLVLRSDRMVESMRRFVRECREHAVSVLSLPTPFWHELVAAFDREGLALPPSVRLMIIGGEKAQAHRVAQWHAHMAQSARPTRLINAYGPTEATVVATQCELRPEGGWDHTTQREVPIGRPLGNAFIYILDRSLNPVPIGVPGELHVGGPVLARGYLNRPELTKARFIPDPFTEEPGARVYKTGDLARYLADGNIEFLGRVDDQVKIRGFRVEPGEVEAALSGYPVVHQAVVVVKKDANGSERLVAYVVVSQEHKPSVRELRGYLKEKLPEYMVPSAFVTLDGLPLMPNGKVDRKALPAPEVLRPELVGDFVAPRDALEEQLVSIWEEVLGVERVGVHDDFFELGGHSLLATQVISRVRDAFGVDLPLRSLFEEPTVAGWSVAVTQRQAEEANPQEMERILAELEDSSGEGHL